MSDIFLSYASQDVDRVRGIVAALEAQGWSVWWDRALKPGETWPSVIERQLKRARCVVVAWSEAAIRSPWVRLEANQARERKILVPLLLEDVHIPPEFGSVQVVSLHDDPENGKTALVAGIRAQLSRRRIRRLMTAAGVAGLVMSVGLAGTCLTSDQCTRWQTSDVPERSLAVLQFENTLADPRLAEITSVFVDELRETLAQVDQQPVAARSATRALPDTLAPWEIGERLRVRWLLAGTISDVSGQIEIALELIAAEDGYLSDSKRYVRIAADLERLRHEIANDVLTMIGVHDVPDTSEPVTATQASSEAYVLYLRGKSLLRQGQVDGAEDYFLQAQALAPGYPEAEAGLCRVFLSRFETARNSQDFDTARSHCTQALEASERSSDAGLALGDLYLLAGEMAEAEASYTEALELNASSAEAYIGLARISDARGDGAAAERLLRQAVITQRGYWRPYNELGIFQLRAGLLDEARESFDRALSLAPQDGTVLNNLAVANLMVGEFDRAIDAWTRVLQVDPSAAAFGNLGSAYYWSGDPEGAVAMYREAVQRHPEDFRWWSSLGDAQLQLESDEARVSFQRALEQIDRELAINPGNLAAEVGQAPIFAALGESDRARAILEQRHDTISRNPEMAYIAAVASARLDDPDAASRYLKIAADLGYPTVLIQADPSFSDLPADPTEPSEASKERR
ncbi:MAG: tetratricopeptide repeat protein [Pseudomonadales bacterium]